MNELVKISLVLAACSAACGEDKGGELPVPPDAGRGVEEECAVPSSPGELARYLADGTYRAFPSESVPHDSTGPHGGTVRTYVNQLLVDSLERGDGEHPVCSAAIKELYLGNDEVSGYAVYVKVRAESAGGAGFYWFETFSTDADASPDYEGAGERVCVGCHSGGDDFVLTPFPLR